MDSFCTDDLVHHLVDAAKNEPSSDEEHLKRKGTAAAVTLWLSLVHFLFSFVPFTTEFKAFTPQN